jgi:hypothetical protein
MGRRPFLFRQDLRLAGFSEDRLDDLPIHFDLLGGAVESGIDVPCAELVLGAATSRMISSERPRPLVNVAAAKDCRGLENCMRNYYGIGNDMDIRKGRIVSMISATSRSSL